MTRATPSLIRPRADLVEADQTLPSQVDIAIVGGGIIGCSAALWAAEQGYSVALCEKGRIAGEQSSRNWGWVRRIGRDPAEYPLGIESLRIWQGLNARLGADTGFRRCTIVYSAATDAEIRWIDRIFADAQHFGIDSTRLSGAELLTRCPPGSTLNTRAAVVTHEDGRAEPAHATPAIARGARAAGAVLLTGCAVRGIETAAGRVSGIVTEHGRIGASAVILAGGAWSRLFAGNLGIDLPQLRVRNSVMRTMPLSGGPDFTFGNGEFGLRPRNDGGFTIAARGRTPVQVTPDAFRQLRRFLPGIRKNHSEISLMLDRSAWDGLVTPRRWADDAVTPFERCRVLDPAPQEPVLRRALRSVQRAFPAFTTAQIAESWGGIIEVTPDGVPIIDTSDQLPGLVIATGFSGHGFGIGPAAGQLAAELATGAAPLVDPRAFRLARF